MLPPRNCLLRCKTSVAASKCGCSPWWLTDLLNSTSTCLLEETGCWQREVARLEWFLGEEPGLGSPPCGCLPDCQATQYLLRWEVQPTGSPHLVTL